MIAIIDYGMGNLRSVQKGFERVGASAEIVTKAEQIDRAVLDVMTSMIEGHEDELSKQAATMLGQDDLFSQAILENQLLNIDQQIDQMLTQGIPEDARAYLGMMGFKVRIDLHGELLEVIQPGMIDPEE